MNTPLVSVIMPTYNHEQHIAQAIESVLVQECNFSYQLIIGEDFSTDKTREICQSFEDQYSDKIILLPSYKNLGLVLNYKQLFDACKSKYVAILEGDDYWIDKYKLQKQIDVMEGDSNIGLVHTRSCSLYENGEMKVNTHLKQSNKNGYELYKDYYLGKYSIVPLTVCFRKAIFDEFVDYNFCIENQLSTIDNFIFPEMMVHTKVHFIDEITGHYRILSNSISNSKNISKYRKWFTKNKIALDYFMIKYPLDSISKKKVYNQCYFNGIDIGWQNKNIEFSKINAKNISIINLKSFFYYFLGSYTMLYFIFLLYKKTLLLLSKIKQFLIKIF